MSKHLIILVHGIRDPGFWMNDLAPLLKSTQPEDDVVVAAVKVDGIDAFRFLEPTTRFRKKFVDNARKRISNYLLDPEYKDYKKTIIAHSFGTYIVTRILYEDTNIVIDKLIMCGAIVSQNFRWDQISEINFKKGDAKDNIVNEFSPLDAWSIFAKICSFGYGNGGSKGYGAPVCDRQHFISHSEYLTEKFAKCYWVPFIFEDRLEKGGQKPEGYRNPWYFVFTRVPINWMGVALSAAAIIGLSTLLYKWTYDGNLHATVLYETPEQNTGYRPIFSFWGHCGGQADASEIPVLKHKFAHKRGDGTFEIHARSKDAMQVIHIAVSDHPPGLPCPISDSLGSEDEEIGSQNSIWEKEITTYKISFKPTGMFSNILNNNWEGRTEFRFEYDPDKKHEDQYITDFLKIVPIAGVDKGKGSFDVEVLRKSASCSYSDIGNSDDLYEVSSQGGEMASF